MKLVLIEGLPGSGKSTLAERLYTFARDRGHAAQWYPEEDRQHPVHPVELTNTRHQADFWLRCLAGWRGFAQCDLYADSMCFLEGSLFQSTVRFMMEEEQEGAESYIAELQAIIAPLAPVVLYLRAPDARKHSLGTALHRGQPWTRNVSTYLEKTPYARARSLRGPEGMHQLWEDYAALCDGLLEGLTTPKLAVSIKPPEMDQPFTQCVEFLRANGFFERSGLLETVSDMSTQFAGRLTAPLGSIRLEQPVSLGIRPGDDSAASKALRERAGDRQPLRH